MKAVCLVVARCTRGACKVVYGSGESRLEPLVVPRGVPSDGAGKVSPLLLVEDVL